MKARQELTTRSSKIIPGCVAPWERTAARAALRAGRPGDDRQSAVPCAPTLAKLLDAGADTAGSLRA